MAMQKLTIEQVADAARACRYDPDTANWDRRNSEVGGPASGVLSEVHAELVRRMPDNSPSRGLVRQRLLDLQWNAVVRT